MSHNFNELGKKINECAEAMKSVAEFIEKYANEQSQKQVVQEQSDRRFVPQVGDKYYYVSTLGKIRCRNVRENAEFEQYIISTGNTFRTEEAAEEYKRRQLATQRVINAIAKAGGGKFVNGAENYCFYLMQEDSNKIYVINYANQYLPNELYIANNKLSAHTLASDPSFVADYKTMLGLSKESEC